MLPITVPVLVNVKDAPLFFLIAAPVLPAEPPEPPPPELSAWEAVIANELVTTPTNPAPLPVNEPVEEPVNEPDKVDALLLEKDPVNGPSPLAANEPDVTLITD